MAQRLANLAASLLDRKFGKQVFLASLGDIEAESFAEVEPDVLCIFMMSTYGEGDPPDNAAPFCDWLNTIPHTAKSPLKGMRFAMLGVGNSNYQFYNKCAKQSFAALVDQGATSLLDDVGLADDAKGFAEDDFRNWLTVLSYALIQKLGFQQTTKPYAPKLAVVTTSDILTARQTIETPEHGIEMTKRRIKSRLSAIHLMPINRAHKLTASESDATVVHIDLDISRYPELKYTTGDHIGIWPENEDGEVMALAAAMGLPESDLTRRLDVTPSGTVDDVGAKLWNPSWNRGMMIWTLFKRHIEIAAPVSRGLVYELEQFAPNESAKQKLRYVAADPDTFTRFRLDRKITLASVLHYACADQPWKVPLSFVVEWMPALKPRYYSIASASSVHPRQISITVSQHRCKLGREGQVLRGLCSHYLSDMLDRQIPQLAYCHVRRSKFRAPTVPSQPIVMVATGSGIAPFRAFVQHLVKQAELGKAVGICVLYFGCRAPNDLLYEDELRLAEARLGGVLRTVTAYSRARNGVQRAYVQDKLKAERELVGRLLVDDDASLYICGSTRMARGVRDVVGEILCQRVGWSDTQFRNFEASQRRSKRWQEDVWG